MQRLNLNALWLWPLLAVFVVLLMSFEDPLRVALAGFFLSVHGPLWRWLHSLPAAPAKLH